MLIRTRMPLQAGQNLSFALVPKDSADRVIGVARAVEPDEEAGARAPGWVCAIERISPEMRATLDRWLRAHQPEAPAPPPPPPPAPAVATEAPLRFAQEQEETDDPDTAISESTVARTVDSSVDTAPEDSEKVGRRALRSAVARSAVGRRLEGAAPDAAPGPLWLHDLDRRLRASGLDEAEPRSPLRTPSDPFADQPTRLADESPWSQVVQPLSADEPSTEVEKSPFDEDEPTQVFGEDEDSGPSGGSFALISDEIVSASEAAAQWDPDSSDSRGGRFDDLRALAASLDAGPGPAAEEDPFAALEQLPTASDAFAPVADDPFADPYADPAPEVAADDVANLEWQGIFDGASDKDSADFASIFGISIPEPSEAAPPPKPPEPPPKPPEPPAPEPPPEPKPPELRPRVAEPPPEPPKADGARAPADVSFRYNAAQRMLDVSWRLPSAFTRDQREQLEHRMLRVWSPVGAKDGDLITVKLALPDGQVLAMPAEVLGAFADGFDIEIRMPKPAQQKLRRAAQG